METAKTKLCVHACAGSSVPNSSIIYDIFDTLIYILIVNEKLPASKFQYFGKFIIRLRLSCFWSTTNWFGDIKQFHEPWNYGARVTRAFYVFSQFYRI